MLIQLEYFIEENYKYYNDFKLNKNQIKQLLDYITNLQLYKYRCEKALEYLDKIETLAMSDGKIIFSINTFRNILQNKKSK